MSGSTIPDPPVQLKPVAHFMKIASDIERVDPVVAYWVRLFATETALGIDKESADSKTFLKSVLLYLEEFKQKNKENEAVTNTTVSQAHYENFVVALFTKVDTLDREGTANKNTVRMFYTASVLFDAMAVFGTLNEEMAKRAKYAKFKAAYITKCLKAGQTPKPGPIEGSDLEVGAGEQPSESAAAPPPLPTNWMDSNNLPEVPKDEPATQVNLKPSNPEPFIMTPSQKPPSIPSVKPDSSFGSSGPSTFPSTNPTNSSFSNTNSQISTSISATKYQAMDGSPLSPEDLIQGQKYCKFANSALQYDDISTAVLNLEKALRLLKTGQKSD